MTETPEWDSQDSSDYHDGYERGEADAHTDGSLSPAMREAMPPRWLEGYEDGRADGNREA